MLRAFAAVVLVVLAILLIRAARVDIAGDALDPISGIKAQEAVQHYGQASGNVTTGAQSLIIPTYYMLVSRSGADSGFPFQVSAGGF